MLTHQLVVKPMLDIIVALDNFAPTAASLTVSRMCHSQLHRAERTLGGVTYGRIDMCVCLHVCVCVVSVIFLAIVSVCFLSSIYIRMSCKSESCSLHVIFVAQEVQDKINKLEKDIKNIEAGEFVFPAVLTSQEGRGM